MTLTDLFLDITEEIKSMAGKPDPSEATPGEKHVNRYPEYARGKGPNPDFHDYGIGTLKKIVPTEELDKYREEYGPAIQRGLVKKIE